MSKPPARRSLLQRTPLAEWIAAGAGLLLTLGVLGYAGWEAVQEDGAPPEVVVAATEVRRSGAGYLVEFEARNRSVETASAVAVRGELRAAAGGVEESRAVLDYVPGRGRTKGGLYFTQDPRAGRLTLRAEGYLEP